MYKRQLPARGIFLLRSRQLLLRRVQLFLPAGPGGRQFLFLSCQFSLAPGDGGLGLFQFLFSGSKFFLPVRQLCLARRQLLRSLLIGCLSGRKPGLQRRALTLGN